MDDYDVNMLSEAKNEYCVRLVNILSPLDLPSSLSYHTSEMFSRNVTALLSEMLDSGEMNIDLEDEVVSGTILTHEGKILNQHVIDLLDREKEEN